MSKKSTPVKDRRSSLKRSHRDDDEMNPAEDTKFSPNRSLTKRFRPDPDIDLSGIFSEDIVSDTEEDIAKLFEEKFQEKSPASKLSSSFKHFGMKDSKLLKQPKVSSLGRRTLGLTSEERERKRRLNRSLDFPVTPQTPRRSQSRSPKK
ncbi:hypothetical protein HA402_005079 [Bradysia odoriphaga]|nr:hypothetical protein HA402_005079 [Bradysia odoriphaga]